MNQVPEEETEERICPQCKTAKLKYRQRKCETCVTENERANAKRYRMNHKDPRKYHTESRRHKCATPNCQNQTRGEYCQECWRTDSKIIFSMAKSSLEDARRILDEPIDPRPIKIIPTFKGRNHVH